MRPWPWLLGLALIVSASPSTAKACKPCWGDPIQAAIDHSQAILTGRILKTSISKPGSSDPSAPPRAGNVTLEVQVHSWLRPPQDARLKNSAPKGRPITLQISYDGICLSPPRIPEIGQNAVFFVASILPPSAQSPLSLSATLTGRCTTPVLALTPKNGRVEIPTEAQDHWGKQQIPLKKLKIR